MAETIPTEYFIQGITSNGKTFRPSDWCERLCGVMSGFGPGKRGPHARLQYSVYVRPTLLGNVKTVILDSRLRDIEPMAFDFVMNFAKDNDLLDEATVEHAGAKVLIVEIEAMQPGMPLYDAKVTVLGEQIQHHVKEEEGELFPKVRESRLDLKAVGKEMADRKAQLMALLADAVLA